VSDPRSLRILGLVSLLLCTACGEPTPQLPARPEGSGTGQAPEGAASPTYDQSFVFVGVVEDSVLLVPWLMRTTVHPDSVVHETRGWLERSGIWDAFYTAEWTTPPSRAPAKPLPHGNLKLLVQEGDVVDGIIFEDGARRLELALADPRASWGGPRGEVIDLVEGAAYLSDERVEGLVLHLARASSGAAPPGGDWAVLVSGDSLALVIAADAEHGGDREPGYRGWVDLGGAQRQWTDVRVDWQATQAYPPARRDVPVSWRLTSEDRLLTGSLEATASDIQAGSGPGPLLPVRALYEVMGELSVGDRDFPVNGLLVHERR